MQRWGGAAAVAEAGRSQAGHAVPARMAIQRRRWCAPPHAPGRTLPTHSLRRNSRDCQAKGSSRVVPSRRPCSRSATRRSYCCPRRPTDRRVAAGGRGRRPSPLPCDHPTQRRCGIGRGRPARRHAQGRGGARGQAILHSPAGACGPLTSFGATTDARVMRFSAAPGLPAPALTTSVSPLGTSFTTPRIHPVAISI